MVMMLNAYGGLGVSKHRACEQSVLAGMSAAYPNPRPQHPRPVLLDLQPLDIGHGQEETCNHHGSVDHDRSLPSGITPERARKGHKNTGDGYR